MYMFQPFLLLNQVCQEMLSYSEWQSHPNSSLMAILTMGATSDRVLYGPTTFPSGLLSTAQSRCTTGKVSCHWESTSGPAVAKRSHLGWEVIPSAPLFAQGLRESRVIVLTLFQSSTVQAGGCGEGLLKHLRYKTVLLPAFLLAWEDKANWFLTGI